MEDGQGQINSILHINGSARSSAAAVGGSMASAAPSPVGRLARIQRPCGWSAAIQGLVCVRPSELCFLLHCLDLNSISSAPLLTSKEVTEAVAHVQSSDLESRLRSALLQGTVPASASASATAASNAEHVFPLNKQTTFLLQVAPRKAGLHSDLARYLVDDSHSIMPRNGTTAPTGQGPMPSKATTGPEDSLRSLTFAAGAGAGSEGRAGPSGLGHDASLLLDDMEPLLGMAPIEEAADESQGASELACLSWLVAASRSALKAVYEQEDLSRSKCSIAELRELRTQLLDRRQAVAETLQDWRRISLAAELCSNFRAQIQLLVDRHRRKLRQRISAGRDGTSFGDSTGSGSSSGRVGGATGGMLSGSGTLTSDPVAVAMGGSDEDYDAALSKIILQQLDIEAKLRYSSSSNSSAVSGYGAAGDRFVGGAGYGGAVRGGSGGGQMGSVADISSGFSALALRTPTRTGPHGGVGMPGMLGSPFRPGSIAAGLSSSGSFGSGSSSGGSGDGQRRKSGRGSEKARAEHGADAARAEAVDSSGGVSKSSSRLAELAGATPTRFHPHPPDYLAQQPHHHHRQERAQDLYRRVDDRNDYTGSGSSNHTSRWNSPVLPKAPNPLYVIMQSVFNSGHGSGK